jgi:hypothetical protein
MLPTRLAANSISSDYIPIHTPVRYAGSAEQILNARREVYAAKESDDTGQLHAAMNRLAALCSTID